MKSKSERLEGTDFDCINNCCKGLFALARIIDNQNKLLLKKEQENAELKDKLNNLASVAEVRLANWQKYEKENTTLKELVEKYRQAVDKCLHITFMGGGCEVNTIGQYATLVDGYLTDVEGLAKWKN